MASIQSDSHSVYMSAEVVVKIIDDDGHSRLDREIALAPHLPIGLAAPLLASGHHEMDTHEVRYACFTRVPGTTPGMGMPSVDKAAARLLAEDAVQRLDELHNWIPTGVAEETLREPLDHGGFVNHEALFARIENLASLDRDGFIPRRLLDGLKVIAKRAPMRARVDIPIHADCHWGNWLTNDGNVTALLDFEWARFGEPVDDWFFLARFSGPHMETVLDVIARTTTTASDTLRAGCEIREATHITSDLCIALEHPGVRARMAVERLHGLEKLITENNWWRDAG
jgi:aminoglycoside phosphotransferase (APT) family kinase protein